jgi:coproporphyrinogen III oxidase-like Fe-S oxidoreductase
LIDLFGKDIEEVTLEFNVSEIDDLKGYSQAGVNRFSIGVQSFNQTKLQLLNR